MSAKKKLIIIGGKGNGTVLAAALEDIIADGGDWEFLGFLNDSHGAGDNLEGWPTLGKPEDKLAEYLKYPECFFYYALIGAKIAVPRVARLKQLEIGLERWATLVHPMATVSRGASLGFGVFVSPFVYIGTQARIGNHVYIHGNSYIARNTELEDFAYLAPQVTVGAEVVLETGAYLGTASTTIERIRVGAWSVAGSGSNVLKDVPSYAIVVGNPAQAIGSVPYRWSPEGEMIESTI